MVWRSSLRCPGGRRSPATRGPQSSFDVPRSNASCEPQDFTGRLSYPHFEIFGLVTAGRDVGGLDFERESVHEHLRIIVTMLSVLGAVPIRLELTDFTEGRFDPLIEQLRGELRSDAEVVERPDRP